MQQIPGYGIVGDILSLNQADETLIILIFRQERTYPVRYVLTNVKIVTIICGCRKLIVKNVGIVVYILKVKRIKQLHTIFGTAVYCKTIVVAI